MEERRQLLLRLEVLVGEYKSLGEKLVFDDLEILIYLMKELSSTLFYLESHRDQASRDFNSHLYKETKEGMSVNKAEILAKQYCPQLYELRRKMTSGYRIVDSIRSTISYLKQEK